MVHRKYRAWSTLRLPLCENVRPQFSLVHTCYRLSANYVRQSFRLHGYAHIGLVSSVSPTVDVEVSLLDKALVAVWPIASPFLCWFAFCSSRSRALPESSQVLRAGDRLGTSRLRGCTCNANGLLILLIALLDGLHELVNISLKADLVRGIDGLVVDDRLGRGIKIRAD